MRNNEVSVREQIKMIALDPLRGTIEGSCPFHLLNAATLGELLLEGSVAITAAGLTVESDRTFLAPPAADVLRALSVLDPPVPLGWLVRTLHGTSPVPRDVLLMRLVLDGMLSVDEAVQLELVRCPGSYDLLNVWVRELGEGLRSVLYSTQVPNEHTCILLALLDAGRLMHRVLGKAEAGATRARAISMIAAQSASYGLWHALIEVAGLRRERCLAVPAPAAALR
jgi:hypothetical protein